MTNSATYDSFGYGANGAGYDQTNGVVDGWFTDGTRNCRRFQVPG